MKTFDLNEAAAFLRLHPHTLEAKARAGEIPGAKPGKCWVFVDIHLVEWLESKYKINQEKEPECRSIVAGKYGGVGGLLKVERFEKLLPPVTGKRRRNTTTAAVLTFGAKPG